MLVIWISNSVDYPWVSSWHVRELTPNLRAISEIIIYFSFFIGNYKKSRNNIPLSLLAKFHFPVWEQAANPICSTTNKPKSGNNSAIRLATSVQSLMADACSEFNLIFFRHSTVVIHLINDGHHEQQKHCWYRNFIDVHFLDIRFGIVDYIKWSMLLHITDWLKRVNTNLLSNWVHIEYEEPYGTMMSMSCLCIWVIYDTRMACRNDIETQLKFELFWFRISADSNMVFAWCQIQLSLENQSNGEQWLTGFKERILMLAIVACKIYKQKLVDFVFRVWCSPSKCNIIRKMIGDDDEAHLRYFDPW